MGPWLTWNPDGQALARGELQVLQGKVILALVSPPSGDGDQVADLTIGDPVWCDEYQQQFLVQLEFTADNQLDTAFLCRDMGLDHACHRAFISYGYSRVTEICCLSHQFFRM